jgi:acetyl esterase
VLALAASALSGCAASRTQTAPLKPAALISTTQSEAVQNVTVTKDVAYGTADGTALTLDICSPVEEGAGSQVSRPAILAIHGGSWREGNKNDPNWQGVCKWLAGAGFVTFAVNYRLAPQHVFPAQIDDIRTAVRWMRAADQVARYGIDPARIGAFGGSAGGNLAALLGVDGSGPLTNGIRVAAVVDLSGPTDLTAAGLKLGITPAAFQQVELDYLGCSSFSQCPQAGAASPLYQVDSSDPPFFIGQSTDERIPKPQADALVAALRTAGVDATYAIVPGAHHSIGMLTPQLRAKIARFLRAHLHS